MFFNVTIYDFWHQILAKDLTILYALNLKTFSPILLMCILYFIFYNQITSIESLIFV